MQSGSQSKISNFLEIANSFLNPHQEIEIIWHDKRYRSLRNAWVAAKSNDPSFRTKIADLAPLSALDEDNKLCPCDIRQNWDQIKQNTLIQLCAIKFGGDRLSPNYHKHLSNALKLVRTGNARLVYDNYSHDNELGNCQCSQCKDLPGTNVLGETYELVRKSLSSNWWGDPFLDECKICLTTNHHTKVLRYLMYWTQFGLEQFPFCLQHKNEAQSEVVEESSPVYYEVELSDEPLYNHNTTYTTYYTGNNWYSTPAKTAWESFIWSPGSVKEFKVEKDVY